VPRFDNNFKEIAMDTRNQKQSPLTFKRLAALSLALQSLLALPAGAAQSSALPDAQHRRHDLTLMEQVRRGTGRFREISIARAEGWLPGTQCVSGPEAGAMGVHYVNGEVLGKNILDPSNPTALIYEPQPNGAQRLVGVEFIVLADAWSAANGSAAPKLEGNLFNYVGAPNRYGLPAFYELHVWAWENNPHGSFADWNTQVTCDNQAGDVQ
jgi:hypothetical protein